MSAKQPLAPPTGTLDRLRDSATAAYVVPFVLFMAMLPIPSWKRVFPDNSTLPWWRSSPEHWIYPIQALACLALLWFWRKHYPIRPIRGWLLAIGTGVLGITLWLAPVASHDTFGIGGGESLLRWLGFRERLDGFDPTLFDPRSNPVAYTLTIAFRMLRLVIVVPLVEEIFWRGFLMRWLVDSGRRWDQIPIGTFSWPSFLITTLLFASIHQPADWAAALLYGALAGWLTVWTRSLGAVILMHAIANLLLGIFVMKTGFWGLW